MKPKPLTQQEILATFRVLGLETEEQRVSFRKLAGPPESDSLNPYDLDLPLNHFPGADYAKLA